MQLYGAGGRGAEGLGGGWGVLVRDDGDEAGDVFELGDDCLGACVGVFDALLELFEALDFGPEVGETLVDLPGEGFFGGCEGGVAGGGGGGDGGVGGVGLGGGFCGHEEGAADVGVEAVDGGGHGLEPELDFALALFDAGGDFVVDDVGDGVVHCLGEGAEFGADVLSEAAAEAGHLL